MGLGLTLYLRHHFKACPAPIWVCARNCTWGLSLTMGRPWAWVLLLEYSSICHRGHTVW